MRERIGLAIAAALMLAVAFGCAEQPAEQPETGREATEGPSEGEATGQPKAVVESTGTGYTARLDPEDFVSEVTHQYFPLKVGNRWQYRATSDGDTETIDVEVQEGKKTILGIPCTVVRDTVRVKGEILEDTFDWYAQDRDGTVWYMGEDTKEYENGKVVTTAGSWEAGKDGAQPGVIMQADPQPGPRYWQEFYKGEAEDQARIIALDGTATVPLGEYENLLVTEENSPLEPKVRERKYYAKGIGVVREKLVAGGEGVAQLVRFTQK